MKNQMAQNGAEGLEGELANARARIKKLESFASYFSHCPCCDETETCVAGCTFENDCPEEFERMMLARYALK